MLLLLGFIVFPISETDALDFMSMSLEELSQVKVFTAAKTEEAAWEATAVVTVVSAREIQLFGGKNLFEVLNRVPGLDALVSAGVNELSVRGGDAFTSPFHVLFLVDGRPLRTSGGNISTYMALHAFSLDIIKRIEVVRGPGSVLYGTNAMEGVINIITWSEDDEVLSLHLKGGSQNSKSFDSVIAQNLGSVRLQAGVFYNDTEGWDYPVATSASTVTHKDAFDDSRSMRLSLSNEHWNFSVLGGRVKEFSYISFIPTLSYHSDVWMADLGYKRELGSNWSVDAHATFNSEDFVWKADPHLDVLPFETKDHLLEATFFGKVGDNTTITLGAVAQDVVAIHHPGLFGTYFKHNGRSYSAYGQAQFHIGERFDVLVGGQFNQVVDFDSDLVPRFSAGYQISESLTFNLFYAGAFRSPLGLELKIDTPGVQGGNPDLSSEHSETLEGRLFFHKDKSQVVLVMFQSNEKDLIQLIPTEEYAIGQHFNVGQIVTRGLELEARHVSDNWYLTGAFTFQGVEDDMGNKDVTHAPNYQLKLGLGYTNARFSAGFYAIASDAFKHTGQDEPYAVTVSPESKPFQLYSLKLGYNFKLGELGDLRWEIYGANLSDESVRSQDLLYNANNSLPGWEPRNLTTALKLSF